MIESYYNDTNTTTLSKTRRRRRTAMGLAALVAAACASPANAFGPVQSVRSVTVTGSTTTSSNGNSRTPHTALHFHTGTLEGIESLTAASTMLQSPLLQPSAHNPSQPQQQHFHSTTTTLGSHTMPAWLSMNKSHLAEFNLQKLERALHASFFTENEALKLLFAIQEAARGDQRLIAGVTEFCLMLCETMELGMEALLAAAFHYCSCVVARQQRSNVLSERFHMASFGEPVVQIARDAARLKELEMVATRVVEQKEQHTPSDAENLRKMLLSESKDWRALAIRSAACLYRLQGLLDSTDSDQLDAEKVRVAREGLWIYAPIASQLGMHRLKSEIEGAAFQVLYRRQYEQVIGLTNEPVSVEGPSAQESMNEVLQHVQEEMKLLLEKDEHFSGLVKDFAVTARVKEPYSMWRKMLKNGYQHIWEVPDAIALRVVLNAEPFSEDEPEEAIRARERALCYYAQHLCTQTFEPSPENPRFKDYIAQPKANGYQSLHYTAKTSHGNKDWSLEVQVRSGAQHRVAEFGLASHWNYKLQNKSTAAAPVHDKVASDAYMKLVQQWHWEQQGGASLKEEDERSILPELDGSWLEAAHSEDLVLQSQVRSERIRARTQRIQPYIDALETAQSDLSRDFVFVFFEPSGGVLSLPAGACVVDALRKGCNGVAWQYLADTNLNGSKATVTKRLNNGDVLTVANLI